MEVTGLVLAGGAGRRVDGQDKGLLPWRGRPLIEHVLQRLQPQVKTTLISCNRNIDRYRQYGLATVQDANDGYAGPLAGLAAAAQSIDTPLTAIVPCDCPTLPETLVARLSHQLQDQRYDVAIAFDGQRDQYLFAVLRTKSLHSISAHLRSGRHSVKGWYATQHLTSVDFSDCVAAFSNLNNMQSLSGR